MSNPRMRQPRPPSEEEKALKAKAREEMVRDRCRLLAREPFIGKLALHLQLVPVVDCRLATACTDGTHLYFDALFYLKLEPSDRVSLLAHEVWHCGLRHLHRLGDRDRDRFNYACDIEVDSLLLKSGFKIEMLPFNPEWIEKSATAEQIYSELSRGLERFKKREPHLYPGDTPEVAGGDASGRPGNDDGAAPGNVDGNGQENGPETGPENGAENGQENGPETPVAASPGQGCGRGRPLRPGLPRVRHDYVIDPDYCPSFSEDSEDIWKNNLKTAAQQLGWKKGRGGRFGRGIGSLPGNVAGLIEDDSEATVDWKRVLLDYVSQTFGGERRWLPPSRRYVWRKLYLPSRAKKSVIEIVLAVDTSGSTTEDLPEFLAELRGMVAAFGEYHIVLIQCDAAIHSVKVYSNEDPLPEKGLVFHGFGGTSLIPPFRYVEEKMETQPNVFIYLTDGGGPVPEKAPDYPVIWCLTRYGCKPAPWGLAVRIDSDENKDGE